MLSGIDRPILKAFFLSLMIHATALGAIFWTQKKFAKVGGNNGNNESSISHISVVVSESSEKEKPQKKTSKKISKRSVQEERVETQSAGALHEGVTEESVEENASEAESTGEGTGKTSSSETGSSETGSSEIGSSEYEAVLEIQKKVQAHLTYPAPMRAQGIQGEVILEMVVTQAGLLESLTIEKSSGSLDLDKEAVNAVHKSLPFSEFAERLKEDTEVMNEEIEMGSFTIKLPIEFRLTS